MNRVNGLITKYALRWSVFVLLGLALFLTIGLQIVAVMLSIAATYWLLKPALSKHLFDSVFYRIIITIFGYFVILQSVILSVWFINHNFPLHLAVYVTLGLLGLSIAWLSYLRKGKKDGAESSTGSYFSGADGLAVGITVLIVAVTIVGPIRNARIEYHGQVPISTVINFMDTSIDDTNHLSRINDRLQLDRGVLYKTNLTGYVVLGDSISTYPPGWHAANAAIMRAFDPHVAVGGQSIIAYVISKTFWYLILLYLFARFIFMLHRRLHGTGQGYLPYVWLTGTTIFFAFYMLIEQYREGFYSFVPELISLLIAGPLLLQLGSDKLSQPDNKFRSLMPLLLTTTGATLTWVLAMPALLFAIVVASLAGSDIKQLLLNIRGSLKALRLFAPLVVFAVLSILCQLLLLRAGSSRSFSAGVNDPGAISIHSSWYFAFIVAGLILFYLGVQKERKSVQELTLLLAGLFGFATFIYIFQMATINHIEYYTYKTLNTGVIIGLPMAIIGWLWLLRNIQSRQSYITKLALSGTFLVGLPLCLGLNPVNASTLGYIHANKRAFTGKELTFIYNSLNERAAINFRYRGEDVVAFYTPGMYGHNVIGTNLLRSIQHIDPCENHVFSAILADDEQKIITDVKRCSIPRQHLTIITSQQEEPHLASLVAASGLDYRISVEAL